MKITRIGPSFPLLTASTLGGGGGSITPSVGSGLVPISNGSNSWAWGSNVQWVTANGSNILQGPFVNFASGSGVSFSAASNTLTIGASGGGSGSSIYINVKDAPYNAVGDGVADDTSEIQAAIDAAAAAGGGVAYCPAGTYSLGSAVVLHEKVILRGDGREATIFQATANSINLVSMTGTAMYATYEVDIAPGVYDIGFAGNSQTGVTGIAFIGVGWFAVERCAFRDMNVGVNFYGSLQATVHDCKFVGNATGILLTSEIIGYYSGVTPLPPSRVLISWSTFFANTGHGIDYEGGEQLIVRDCEFGYNGTTADASTSAIKVAASGDPPGPGLQAHNLWMEGNKGYAVIQIVDSASAHRHTLTDIWIAYGSPTYSIAVDGTTSVTHLLAERVYHDTAGGTPTTFYRTGTKAYLDLRNCSGTLAGSGGVIRQEPLLDETKVSDLSQFIALRLPNLTTTARDAIAAPTAGMLIWNTTTAAVNWYSGSAWTAAAAAAPATVDYLVGTASGDLSAEIVVGTTPGGELGGTWASPTVDPTHSGSMHMGPILISDTPAGSPLIFADLLQDEDGTDLLYADAP